MGHKRRSRSRSRSRSPERDSKRRKYDSNRRDSHKYYSLLILI